jgi:photosystem II stability/assembly factor-like uncharacterized protein
MKIILQTLFFFLLTAQICFAQWYQQNSGTTKNLNAMYFVDTNNGWIVGDSGIVLHTTNEGTTWSSQLSGTTIRLNDVFFTNSLSGIAVGGDGTIIHTTDGGQHWTLQMSGTELPLWCLFFLDENTGWAVGGDVGWWGSGASSGVILKSINGGLNWDIILYDSSHALFSVFFIDSQRGWVGGEDIAYRTTDDGSNWSIQSPLFGGQFFSIHFNNISNGWMAGSHRTGELSTDGDMVHTTDGGITWIDCGNAFDQQLIWIHSYDNNNAIVIGRWGEMNVYTTSDAGTTWITYPSGWDPGWVNLTGLYGRPYFFDSLIGWVPAEFGTILHTTNGGVSFVEEEQIDEVPNTYFLSNNFPNPFNPSTKIKYSILQSSNVVIRVFDVLGNEIETLVNEEKSVGIYEITWNAENLPSGVYFYQLQAGNYMDTKKMVLLK